MTEIEPSTAPSHDMRPLVGGAVSNRALWLFGASLVATTAVLFGALQSRRLAITEPATGVGGEEAGAVIAPAPPLSIPLSYQQFNTEPPGRYGGQTALPPTASLVPRFPQAGRLAAGQLPQTPMARSNTTFEENDVGRPAATTRSLSPSPQVVYDGSRARPDLAGEGTIGADSGKGESRVKASRFANPSTTVPKGTVIQAVMETALDSTRAGFARAIVSRDIYGFDGSKILIGKGSRLIGEYKADLASGQSRALIQWQRLMRPDGVLINLDSPSADPLGRAGVKGKVNNHFFEKFGGAILQSALDIGVEVASNKIADGTTIYALPGSFSGSGTSGGANLASPEKVQPTLTVRQGTSVSVFVARDLDFTAVDQ